MDNGLYRYTKRAVSCLSIGRLTGRIPFTKKRGSFIRIIVLSIEKYAINPVMSFASSRDPYQPVQNNASAQG
jgi:hypothetical protein